MGPCIAAAVLNHSQGKAWLVHESGWSVNSQLLDDIFDDARAAAAEHDKITLWLLGACIGDTQDPEVVEMTRADRKMALERAQDRFPSATIVTEFSDDPEVMSMSVEFEYDGSKWVEEMTRDSW